MADQEDWRYVPFFDHPEVQECAISLASEMAETSPYSANAILEEARRYNDYLPTLTKSSSRVVAHAQLRVLANIWIDAQQNLRPGFSFSLHEYGQGLVRVCTFTVFDHYYSQSAEN